MFCCDIWTNAILNESTTIGGKDAIVRIDESMVQWRVEEGSLLTVIRCLKGSKEDWINVFPERLRKEQKKNCGKW